MLRILILVYCVWNALHLLTAWREAPLEHDGWLLLLTWTFPLFYYWFFGKPSSQAPLGLLSAALVFSLLGSLSMLNVLKDVGLALALGSFLPTVNLLWLASAIFWMPAAGWFGSHYILGGLFWARFALIILPTAWMVYCLKRQT